MVYSMPHPKRGRSSGTSSSSTPPTRCRAKGRFRVNVLLQRDRSVRHECDAVDVVDLRPRWFTARSETCGIPAARTGAYHRLTGSGTSTTLASLIDIVNVMRSVQIRTHVGTERVLPHAQAIADQPAGWERTAFVASALKHVLRQDPGRDPRR